MTALSADEVLDRLHKLGQAGDDELPLAETALLLANLDRTGLDLTPYRAHLDRLVHDAREALAVKRRYRLTPCRCPGDPSDARADISD